VNFIVSIWAGTRNVAVVSTCDKGFVRSLTIWAEVAGYEVRVKKSKLNGEEKK
jgi:hypothetical protein